MNNYKVILSDGRTAVRLNTTKQEVVLFAKDVRFNGNRLDFKIVTANLNDVNKEKERLENIQKEYDTIFNYNSKVNRYNSALAKARNHNEFMNASYHLR